MNNKNTDIMKNQYGSSYEGKVVNGIPHGKGIITYPKGDIYEGDMTKDQVPFINSVNVSAT